MTTATTITAEELLQLPDNHMRRELVRGEVREMAPAGKEHGSLAMRTGWRLGQHVDTHQLGEAYAAETGFILSRAPDTVRAPDAAFVSADRLPSDGLPDGFLELAPDLVVEVVSPNDRPSEVREKVAEWLEAGTRMVVVLYPSTQTATVHRPSRDPVTLSEQDTLSGDDVVSGFSVRVGELFC